LFTWPPLQVLFAVFGADRVLFSIDYPYSSNRLGRDFLDSLKMPAAELEKFAHGNADRLLKLRPS
jgi:predicted TIM-barrel fold metal-dependent hydrolase